VEGKALSAGREQEEKMPNSSLYFSVEILSNPVLID
jgi:hypothetical protein